MISSLAVALRGVGYDSQTWALRGWVDQAGTSDGRGDVLLADFGRALVLVSDAYALAYLVATMAVISSKLHGQRSALAGRRYSVQRGRF